MFIQIRNRVKYIPERINHVFRPDMELHKDFTLLQLLYTSIIDALTPPKGQCEERLWESADEMNW